MYEAVFRNRTQILHLCCFSLGYFFQHVWVGFQWNLECLLHFINQLNVFFRSIIENLCQSFFFDYTGLKIWCNSSANKEIKEVFIFLKLLEQLLNKDEYLKMINELKINLLGLTIYLNFCSNEMNHLKLTCVGDMCATTQVCVHTWYCHNTHRSLMVSW